MAGFPVVLDWKDLVTDDCTLILDLDQICYVSAAGSEKRSIVVTHKKSGREMTFKNASEFWGRGKKAIGGWLADQNMNRKVQAEAEGRVFTPWTREDFEIRDKQVAEPVEYCLHLLKMKIDAIFDHLEMDHARGVGVLGGEGNFRLLLPSPQVYKGNRKDMIRPLLLEECRNYVEYKYHAKVVNGIEADDYITMLGWQGWLNYQATGKFNYMICTFDKDNRQAPCLLFNPQRAEGKGGKADWVYPTPMLIDDSMGQIWLKKGEVKGWGKLFFGYQMLVGDATDNIRPYQWFDGCRFGDKAAFELIGGCKDEKEMWTNIVDQYKTWFPSGKVEFTNFDGNEICLTVGQWMSIIFSMVYMKRSPNDKTTLASELKRVGVI